MPDLLDQWPMQLSVVLTMAYAMALGGLVGWERELKNRPAGFRTHMLICGTAAMLVGLTDLLSLHFAAERYEALQMDPIRVIEAVVAAVGFLGAGAIFRRSGGASVNGLTTAASMLMVAVIGIAVGLGAHVLALGATVLTLAVLLLLKAMEARMERHSQARGADRREQDAEGRTPR